MGTILASSIIDRAEKTLYDETNVQWPRAELLESLNDAQRAAVLVLPETYSLNQSHQLVKGSRQEIPAAGLTLIDVVRNVGGRAVREIDRSVLDHTEPTWHTPPAGAAQEVRHFSYDTRDRRRFYVYPAQPAVNPKSVEIVFSSSPPEVGAEGDAITIDDIYQPALLSYLLHRAYSKDGAFKDKQAMERQARINFDQFALLLTGRKADDERLHPLQPEHLMTQ